MTKTKKIVLPCLLGGVLLAGSLGAAMGAVFGTAAESVQLSADSPAALWEVSSGVKVEENVDVPDYMLYGKEFKNVNDMTEYTPESADLGLEEWQKNGVKFTPSAANRWVDFENVVDISSFTANDILLAFTPLTSTRGNAEIYEFDVKITDAENEDNYILITSSPSQWYPATFRAQTQMSGPFGYQYGDYHPGYNEGTYAFSDKYLVGFDGTTNETAFFPEDKKVSATEVRHRSIILHYDYEDKAIWVTGQFGTKFCIMDLDWSESVGYGNEWPGFTSGKVKLSFCSKQHRSGEPSYMILNAFNTPMNGSAVTDTQAPVYVFGDEVQENAAPTALVGRTYVLPTVDCLDVVSGAIDCNITVTDPDGYAVPITENTVVPDKEGFYTISYEAKDASGNTASKKLRFTAQKAVPPISIKIEDNDRNVTIGKEVVIPSAEFNVSDGAFIVNTSVKVVRAGSSDVVVVEEGTFVPLFAGEYRIIYTAVDWLGIEHSESIVCTAVAADGAVAHGSLQHMRRLFDGVPVILPELNAFDYKTIPGIGLAQEAEVILSGNGVTETYKAGSVFTPDIEKFGAQLNVEYKVNGTTIESYTVELYEMPDEDAEDYVDDGSYQLDDYFICGEGVSVEFNEGGAETEYFRIRTATGLKGDRSFGFVNPLRGEGFNISFFIPADMKNFEAIRISLRDSFDSSIGFDLLLEDITESTNPDFKNMYTFLTTNGGKKYALTGTYNYDKVVSMLTITYRDGAIFDINNNKVCVIEENFDGKIWNGFSSGMVYLDITFEGVGALSSKENGNCAAMALSSLCGQAFYVEYDERKVDDGKYEYHLKNFVDISTPQIVMSEQLPTSILLGDKVDIPVVQAYDALSPYVEVSVSVQAPNGSMVIKNNTPLKDGMSFVIENYGMYYLRYTAKDAAGLTYTSTYTVSAADMTAPTIALSGNTELTGKVGKTIRIPVAVVQDNRDKTPRLFIFVIRPDASMLKLGEVTAENNITGFKPTAAGHYTIIYYAIDADYNATVQTVSVNVK